MGSLFIFEFTNSLASAIDKAYHIDGSKNHQTQKVGIQINSHWEFISHHQLFQPAIKASVLI